MKLTLIAATGGIGRATLEQALAAGHDVTAVVRAPSRLPSGVRAVACDLTEPDPGALTGAVAGADAVLSALGPRSTAEAGVTTRGTRAVVDAMRAAGTRRLVVVSAAPIGTVAAPGRPRPARHDPGDGPVMRHLVAPLLRAALGKHYADLAEMEEIVRASGLEWTIVRPPRLTDKPATGRYRTAYGRNIRGGTSVSRADVAHYLLDAVTRPDSVGHTVGIAT